MKNSPDLAKVLAVGDYCDRAVEEFAAAYADATIAFNGSISAMNRHQGASTRFDIGVAAGAAGAAGANSATGPAFRFNDVGIIDLWLTGPNIPDTVRVDDKFWFKATIGEFNPDSCLLELDPVETLSR